MVDYEGAKHLEQTKIDEKLKEENAQIRLDSFIDPAMVRKVKKIVLDMLAEKGYQFASVTPEIKPIARRPEAGEPDLRRRRGAAGQDPRRRVHRQQGGQRRQAQAPDEEQQGRRASLSFITGARQLPGRRSTRRTPTRSSAYYRDHGYIARARRRPRAALRRGLGRPQDALGHAADPGRRGRALPGRPSCRSRATRSSSPRRCGGLFKVQAGRLVQRQGHPEGLREGARPVRRGRLLPVQPRADDAARTSRTRARARGGARRGRRGGQAGRAGRSRGRSGARPSRAPAKPDEAGRRPRPKPPRAGARSRPQARRSRRPPSRCPRARRSWTSCCRWTRASSTSSTGSSSPATRPRATRSCAARSGCSRKASSTPRR